MNNWRGFGVETCVRCRELYTFNHVYFPTYFLRDEEVRGVEDLICVKCIEKAGKSREEQNNDLC